MIFPMSVYPQSKPEQEGNYLVHNEILDKWYVVRWQNERKLSGGILPAGWQGLPSVDYFIPFPLLVDNQKPQGNQCI